MKIAPHRLNHLIEFGTTKTVSSHTLEGSKETFVPQLKLHFAYYQRTQALQYQLVGMHLQDTIEIAVRKNKHVNDKQLARIVGQDTIYKIINYSRDLTGDPIGFDLITLRDIKKIGSGDNG